MKKIHPVLLALLTILIGTYASGCSLRVLQKRSSDKDGHQLPPAYSQPVRSLLELPSSAIIEDSLLAAYAVLEDQWGQKKPKRPLILIQCSTTSSPSL